MNTRRNLTVAVTGPNSTNTAALYNTISDDTLPAKKIKQMTTARLDNLLCNDQAIHLTIKFLPNTIYNSPDVRNADFAIYIDDTSSTKQEDDLERNESHKNVFTLCNPILPTYHLAFGVNDTQAEAASADNALGSINPQTVKDRDTLTSLLVKATTQFLTYDDKTCNKALIEAFRSAHREKKNAQFSPGFTLYYRKTHIDNTSDLPRILKNALHKKSSVSNQVCVDKKWLTPEGKLHDNAPEAVKFSYDEALRLIAEENNSSKLKKLRR